jgi:hypothetical protein
MRKGSMLVNNKYSLIFKKSTGHPASYGLEITAALLLKFTLLGALWWLFFAGHKQPGRRSRYRRKNLRCAGTGSY